MEKKLLQNTRIGISEKDIMSETSRDKLFDWSIEIQKDINDLKGRMETASSTSDPYDQEKYNKWQYVLRIQGLLKQRVQHRIGIINAIQKDEREKRFEFAFVNIARRLLKDDVFQEIRTQAMEELSL